MTAWADLVFEWEHPKGRHWLPWAVRQARIWKLEKELGIIPKNHPMPRWLDSHHVWRRAR